MRKYEENLKADKAPRLYAMGIVQITLGGLSVIFALFSALAAVVQQVLPGLAEQPPGQGSAMWMSAVMYALIGAFFFWIGLGSLRYRRWVRPVVLCVMWPFFLVGIVTFLGSLLLLPHIPTLFEWVAVEPVAGGPVPRSLFNAVIVFAFGVLFVVSVVVPGLHVWLYRSQDVQQTCVARDPKERWTDRCPTQVLGVVVWLLLASGLLATLIPMGVFVLFCFVIQGAPAMGALAVSAVVAAALAWAVYLRKPVGFWGTVLFFQILLLGWGLGFVLADGSQVGHGVWFLGTGPGHPSGSLAVAVSNGTAVFFVANAVAVLIYLITVRKYFLKKRDDQPAG